MSLYKEIKNIKNVKRCGDGAKKYANKVGMMHESMQRSRIGKAPSLHLFHTTVRQHP